MKKTAAIILALAMALSMAACSEGAAGKDLPVATQNSIPDPDSSIGDMTTTHEPILTPPTTEIEDITSSEYTEFTYFSKTEEYDKDTMIRRYYEGEIKDEKYTKQIFEKLKSILKNNAFTPQGEQSVSGGANAMLTFKKKNGEEYRLCTGILTHHPMEEGGEEVYILQTPHATYYFGADYKDKTSLDKLVAEAVKNTENLVKTVLPQETPTTNGNAVQPDNPIAFITVRSNYAWGRELRGSCVDTAGRMYTFNYSKVADGTYSGSFEERILQLIKQHGVHPTEALYDVIKLREAISYAKKADPGAEFTKEHKMCDYGQKSLYAVVDGKAFMLQSIGDVDKLTTDANAQKAVEYYTQAESGATVPAVDD